MIAVKAHFDGSVIVPDEPVDLPKGQELVAHLELATKAKETQQPPNVFDWLAQNSVETDLAPNDLSHQHDHYLYGTPKKQEPTSFLKNHLHKLEDPP